MWLNPIEISWFRRLLWEIMLEAAVRWRRMSMVRLSGICCHDRTCFGTMVKMEAKSTLSLEGIVSKVDMTWEANRFSRIFEYWSDYCWFEKGRTRARGEVGVSDEGNEQEKRRKAEFEQVCGQRVKTRMYSGVIICCGLGNSIFIVQQVAVVNDVANISFLLTATTIRP